MRTFEVGKRYNDGAATFEIVKRTAKFVTYVYIHHPGRCNEKRGEEKRTKIYQCPGHECEVFATSHYEVEA